MRSGRPFWSMVDKSGGQYACWPWTGYIAPNGYGRLTAGKAVYAAHRRAWQLAVGGIPHGLSVLHHCDCRECCNPSHLFVGSQGDNMKDMVRKGRSAKGDRNGARLYPELRPRGNAHYSRTHPERLARGERSGSVTKPESRPRGVKHANHKLSEEQVIEIRKRRSSGVYLKDLANDYGVCIATIHEAIHKNWKHVQS